jgi:hypothetical protein
VDILHKILNKNIRHTLNAEALEENHGTLFGLLPLYDLRHKILKIMFQTSHRLLEEAEKASV